MFVNLKATIVLPIYSDYRTSLTVM